jgi:RNA polymerase sigma factor (sigma-70 family)
VDLTPEHDALLDEALAGDEAALVRLLEVVGPVVRARIEPKMGRHVRASLEVDDLMQVTYIEAVTRIKGFTGGGAKGFLAWVSRIAENNLIDAARMIESAKRPDPRKRVTNRPGEDSMVALVEAIGATYSTPSRVAARDELPGVFDRMLSQLPAAYAQVIRLYDLQGWSVKAVAEELGKSEGAVYMLRARAHDRLKEVMGSESRYFTPRGRA